MRYISPRSKIAVAMSGGVDSGVAAALLIEQGYAVVGFFMHLWYEEGRESRCCSAESLEAARRTAGKLGIPLYTVDYREDFKGLVVDYFLSEYRAGRTPNPCVVCNKVIKFGKLLDYASDLGCDYLATGHYARLRREAPSAKSQVPNICLLQATDEGKDQSYFLWQLAQEQLARVVFPVGGLAKERVREIAEERGLPVARRPESFEICFVPDSLGEFLRRHLPEEIKPGSVLNVKGEVIGRHQGLPLYTYGQRRGFALDKYQGIPLYVVGIDKGNNTLIVGRGAESEVKEFEIKDLNWISPRYQLSTINYQLSCSIRIRHQGELLPATVEVLSEGRARVILDEPMRAVTPGQSAVFYEGNEVLGGGVIAALALDSVSLACYAEPRMDGG